MRGVMHSRMARRGFVLDADVDKRLASWYAWHDGEARSLENGLMWVWDVIDLAMALILDPDCRGPS